MHRCPYAWLIVLLPALTGCLHFVHKNPKSDPCVWKLSDQVPEESKSCVYVFLFDPLDPLTCSNLKGVRDYLHQIGFIKTYYGQAPHLSYFLEKMQAIHGRCGTARFAVVGYHVGADSARQLADLASQSGLPVDLVLYLEPRGDAASELPAKSLNTITLRAEDLPPIEKHHDGEHSTHQVGKTGVPTHPKTLSILERELSLIAMTVPPPVRPEAKKVPLVDPMPHPREGTPKPRELPEEWQFLRPRNPWRERPQVPQKPEETLPTPMGLPELPAPKPK